MRASDFSFLIYFAMPYLISFSCLILKIFFTSFLFELSTSKAYFFLIYTNRLMYLDMEIVFSPLVSLQMHNIKLYKCHLSLRGPSTLVSWAYLCSRKKVKLRLLEVICTKKAKKLAGSIVLAVRCV